MPSGQLQNAKAKLSEVIRRAAAEPQEITVRGASAEVVISVADYQRLAETTQNLGDFLRASPLYGLDLDFSRDTSLPREVSLD
jgi:prevent-host-death family protein